MRDEGRNFLPDNPGPAFRPTACGPNREARLSFTPIIPARVSFRDRALFSEQFGDVYFSLDGGLEESRHVFLAGNDLPGRFAGRRLFTILELGFGCGLNFLAAWQAFREQAPARARLHFISAEKHPLLPAGLAQAHSAWPQLGELSAALLAGYPPMQSGFHRLHFDGGRVALTLLFGDALETLGELEASVDAFFLDGFAPARNPEMWSAELFAELRRVAAAGATAATYSVAGGVRQGLERAGFAIEKRRGFGRKREMLFARYAGAAAAPREPDRTVAVVGAGIAGTSCALALARCGFEVDLLESGQVVALGASSNPGGLVRPFVNLEQGARSRFTWAAFNHAARLYDALAQTSRAAWSRTGVLQLARDSEHLGKLERALSELSIPATLARMVDGNEGSALCGARVSGPGVWFPGGGWLAGRAASEAILYAAGPGIRLRTAASVGAIERDGETCLVRDESGDVLSSAAHVVLANGHNAAPLLRGSGIELRAVRGQVSLLPARLPWLRAPVCQEGYVTPLIGGAHLAGATYDQRLTDPDSREEDDAANLMRARRMLPGAFDAIDPGWVSNWVGLRCVSRDRRPVLGELAPRLHACLALGSRGFTWAPLAGELVASALAGEPLPIERSVAAAISPRRFASRTD
jgi:tRNA 5-methylaminomethyl-2-thiouridine biosynthesis bifunctional protein